MMKTISNALLGTALLASAAHATDGMPVAAPASACDFSGFYLGLGIGQSFTKDKLSQSAVVTTPPPSGPTAAGNHSTPGQSFALDGINGGVFAGYGKQFSSRMYAGLEVQYLFGDGKDSHKIQGLGANKKLVPFELKKKDSLSAALRLGLAMNNALPYILVGYDWSKFETKTEDYSAAAKKLKESKRLGGFMLGAGIDVKLSQKIMMGLQYTFTDFDKLKGKKHAHSDAAAVSQVDHLKFKRSPETHKVMLRVGYTF